MFKTGLTWQDAKQRANIIHQIRAFFNRKGVIEVETPQLSNGTVTDVHLDAFKVEYRYLAHENRSLYLQTSPEFAMKRLLASGYGSIYQLAKAYRDEGFGQHHNPEFTMLEWYRLDFSMFELMAEVKELLIEILAVEDVEFFSYQQIFIQHLEFDPLTVSLTELKGFIAQNQIEDQWLQNESNKDTLLQFIFYQFIEKAIGQERPCFIYHFPSSQASLAEICQEDDRVAERFECYYRGIELANGFNELTDADEQKKRFIADNELRKTSNKSPMPIDSRFIAALERGLPQCAGVALGVDRLIMLALNKTNIEQVITFTIDNA